MRQQNECLRVTLPVSQLYIEKTENQMRVEPCLMDLEMMSFAITEGILQHHLCVHRSRQACMCEGTCVYMQRTEEN